MFSTKRRGPSRKQLRSFGLIVAAGFLLIGSFPMLRHQSPRIWALAISLVFGVAGLLIPAALRQAYYVWMTAGECLGWVNSRVLLGVIYYLLVTPIRLLMSAFGHDPMNRSFDHQRATYRVSRKPRPSSHMTHQF